MIHFTSHDAATRNGPGCAVNVWSLVTGQWAGAGLCWGTGMGFSFPRYSQDLFRPSLSTSQQSPWASPVAATITKAEVAPCHICIPWLKRDTGTAQIPGEGTGVSTRRPVKIPGWEGCWQKNMFTGLQRREHRALTTLTGWFYPFGCRYQDSFLVFEFLLL